MVESIVAENNSLLVEYHISENSYTPARNKVIN